MSCTGKTLKRQHASFLRWMYEKYGQVIPRIQFSDLACESGNNDVTIMHHMQRLVLTKCISIEHINSRKHTITIDVEQSNKLLAEMGEELIKVKN